MATGWDSPKGPDWELIARIFSALNELQKHHGWDLDDHEMAKYAESFYTGITEHGFPRSVADYKYHFNEAHKYVYGVPHKHLSRSEMISFCIAFSGYETSQEDILRLETEEDD